MVGAKRIEDAEATKGVLRPDGFEACNREADAGGLASHDDLLQRLRRGEIDIGNAATELTERMSAGVPQANGTTAVEPRIDVRHVAEAVVYMANLPLDVNVQFMTVMATKMPFVGRG